MDTFGTISIGTVFKDKQGSILIKLDYNVYNMLYDAKGNEVFNDHPDENTNGAIIRKSGYAVPITIDKYLPDPVKIFHKRRIRKVRGVYRNYEDPRYVYQPANKEIVGSFEDIDIMPSGTEHVFERNTNGAIK